MRGNDAGLRLILLGQFSGGLPSMGPHPDEISLKQVRCVGIAQLPASLTSHDVLVTDMVWLGPLPDDARRELARRASSAAAWVAIADGAARFKDQVDWQRQGVTHFFSRPIDGDRLLGLLGGIHDRLSGKPVRVILLDDEESALDYYGTVLEQAGVVVQATQDPLLVLEVLEEFQPDLLVVDIEMPGCRGPELVTIVRQRAAYGDLPVIFLTAMESMQDHLLARQAAAEDFLAKPVAPELLVTAVKSQAWRHRARRRAELAYRRREARSRYRLEQLRMAIDEHAIVSIADADGDIIYANDRFCAISGYSRQELLGSNHRIVKSGLHPPEFFAHLWQTISSGKVWQGVLSNRAKDGSIYWVEATIVPFLDSRNRPVQYISIRTDVTALHRVQEEFAASEERLRRGQAYANIGTWDWNIETGELFWSDRIAPLFGHAEGTLATSYDNFIAAVHADDRQAVTDAVVAAVEHGAPYQIEHRVIWPDGTVRWLLERGAVTRDADGKAVRMLGVVQDIHERKLAELILAEREQQLRESQALAHLGSWQANLVTGEVSWSTETYRIFGRDPARFTPTLEDIFAAVHPEDELLVRSIADQAQRTGFHEVTHRIIRPDGSMRHVHEKGRAERDATGTLVRLIGTVQDITARVEAEARLKETEERFAFAVEGAGDGVWDWNILTGEMPLSGHYEEMLGYGKGELEPTIAGWLATAHPEDLPQVKAILDDYLTGRRPNYVVELRLRCKDGSYKWVLCRGRVVERDAGGNPLRMVGIHSDISERKVAEERLALFRQIFDASGQCVGITDGRGRLIYQNRAHACNTGYTDEEILGQPFAALLPAESAEAISREVFRDVAEDRNWVGEIPIRRRDGSVFMSSSNVGFIKDAGGQLQFLFNIFSDFSDELARRNELAQAKEGAERANQAKSDFLSSMSHELRTPMNAIIGFAQMLEYDTGLNADQHDNVHEILKAGHHLLELINEVLDLAKIESGRVDLSIEPVMLPPAVDDCMHLIRPLATARNIALEVDVDPGTVVRADRVRLKQVLLNLLSNAVKYNREGGRVDLKVGPCRDGWLRLAVADTGVGIPAERMGELFQPFSRLAEHSEIEGTGIGLTITRRLVEMMGGEVGVESRPGEGTTFFIDLPAGGQVATHVKEGNPGAGSGLTGEHCVLCVDDNPVNLKLIAHMLGMRPAVRLITAHLPELGIELALAHRPNLILLDINMPGMDGYQVLDIIKSEARLKHIPVVAITANAMPRDVERGLGAGFTAYLTKPVDLGLFLQTVDRCLVRGEESSS